MNHEEERDQVAWNVAQHLINQIGNLLDYSSRYFIAGNYLKAFTTLKEIKKKIIASLDNNERKSFREKEDKILEKLNLYNKPLENELEAGKKSKERYQLVNLLDDYTENIMEVLSKYGFGVGLKEDNTKMIG